ncbi:MAG: YicC family protein [Chitinophagales bacterium]|nr:YicC family protein [Chitinophagales bacterium]
MVYSMTGFGKASFDLHDCNYTIEIKSLNSKQMDVFTRLPNLLKEMEIPLRKQISDSLLRGKIELNISSSKNEDANSVSINTDLLQDYYAQIKDLNLPSNDTLGALLRLPNVLVSEQIQLSTEDKNIVENALTLAMDELQAFRKVEGLALEADLRMRLGLILEYKQEVKRLAPIRIEKLRTRMMDNLKALQLDLDASSERLEQEMIFFIEKLDVTEEFVRLKHHCEYFEEVMQNAELTIGKKLNFISQEIGREINTLGSKANDAEIQKMVVQMKDELEKIKEQINNVL